MSSLAWPIALFLLTNLAVTLLAAARGPTAADRMLPALLFGTTGTALVALLAHAMARPVFIDVALLLGLLAAIGGIAFAKRAWRAGADDA